MKKIVGLKSKCYVTLMDDDNGEGTKQKEKEHKAKGTKKCIIKRCLMFDNYEESLEEKKKILRKQQKFKSDGHNVYIEEINKVALSFDDDKD